MVKGEVNKAVGQYNIQPEFFNIEDGVEAVFNQKCWRTIFTNTPYGAKVHLIRKQGKWNNQVRFVVSTKIVDGKCAGPVINPHDIYLRD